MVKSLHIHFIQIFFPCYCIWKQPLNMLYKNEYIWILHSLLLPYLCPNLCTVLPVQMAASQLDLDSSHFLHKHLWFTRTAFFSYWLRCFKKHIELWYKNTQWLWDETVFKMSWQFSYIVCNKQHNVLDQGKNVIIKRTKVLPNSPCFRPKCKCQVYYAMDYWLGTFMYCVRLLCVSVSYVFFLISTPLH